MLELKMKKIQTILKNVAASRAAFSLIELIMIMLIISIMSAMAMPRFNSVISSMKLSNAVNHFKDNVRFSQTYATTHHTNTWVSLDEGNNRYTLYEGADFGSRTVIVLAGGENAIYDFADYGAITLANTDFNSGTELSFNWWGMPSSAGTLDLNDITITVLNETGLVTASSD